MSPEQLRREGLSVLHERLGLAGAIRFLREFNKGYGDYTAERGAWLDGWTAEAIAAEIRKTKGGIEAGGSAPPSGEPQT